VLICLASLDKIVPKFVKYSCIILIDVCSRVLFAMVADVSILLLVAWVYVTFGPPSGFLWCCSTFISCSGVFVI
jgi:hypothetical protein